MDFNLSPEHTPFQHDVTTFADALPSNDGSDGFHEAVRKGLSERNWIALASAKE